MSERAYMKRFRRRNDATHKECTALLRELKVRFWEPQEPCDLLIYLPGLGYKPVEIKAGRGRLTAQQEEMPHLAVVRSREQLLELINGWYKSIPRTV